MKALNVLMDELKLENKQQFKVLRVAGVYRFNDGIVERLYKNEWKPSRLSVINLLNGNYVVTPVNVKNFVPEEKTLMEVLTSAMKPVVYRKKREAKKVVLNEKKVDMPTWLNTVNNRTVLRLVYNCYPEINSTVTFKDFQKEWRKQKKSCEMHETKTQKTDNQSAVG